jgi:hypothetical protein
MPGRLLSNSPLLVGEELGVRSVKPAANRGMLARPLPSP